MLLGLTRWKEVRLVLRPSDQIDSWSVHLPEGVLLDSASAFNTWESWWTFGFAPGRLETRFQRVWEDPASHGPAAPLFYPLLSPKHSHAKGLQECRARRKTGTATLLREASDL